MWCSGKIAQLSNLILTLTFIPLTYSVTIENVVTPGGSALTRVPRAAKYPGRYESGKENSGLKPEDAAEINDNLNSAAVEKRCVRCYDDSDRYPYAYDASRRGGYYDGRSRDYNRYSDNDRYYDRDSYYDRDRYDPYGDRDRYSSKGRYGLRDRYDRYDRYDDRDRHNDRELDRYEDPYDPYRSRFSSRGVGYDNRGYDYRKSDRQGYRPWDETYRGTSGFDSAGRGYFAAGRPEYGSTSGYGSYGRYGGNDYGGGYASGWKYGNSGLGRDDYYRDKDRGYGGYSGYRPYTRDYANGYRTTSYLYGRPSTTTDKPINENVGGNTQPKQDNSSR